MTSKSKGKSTGQRESVFGSIRNELRKTHFQLGNDSKCYTCNLLK